MTPTLARRTSAITLIAATTVALAGCAGGGAKLTFNDTEKVKVTDIDLAGHSGDVMVKTAAITETRITRIVHNNGDPGPSYRLAAGVLHLNTDCGGINCGVSYEIETPPGVRVSGALRSGTVSLTDIASADITVSSGDVTVDGVTGPVKVRATSGNVNVIHAAGPVTMQVTSGDARAVDITGGPVVVRATSGDVQLKVDKAMSVTAEVTSGDLQLMIPGGAYKLRAQAGSGDTSVSPQITPDPTSKNVLDLTAGSGDVTVGSTA